MSVNVDVIQRKERVMNKNQRNKLEALRSKWSWESKRAKADPVAYALSRAKSDYKRVVGTETGLHRWQAEVLRQHDSVGLKTREEERERAVTILREAFDGFPSDSIFKALSESVASDIIGVTAPVEEPEKVALITDPRDPAFIYPKPMFRYPPRSTVGALVAGVIVAGAAAPLTQPSWGYDVVWNAEVMDAQSLTVTSVFAPDATRGMGIYIPKMIYPVGSGAPISSWFGHRDAPCPSCSTNHEGIDFNPGYGSPVYSATEGIVTSIGWEGSLGYCVIIQDPGTWSLYYGHMIDGSAPEGLAVGSKVTMGQQIGLVGSTGQSTGAHLHFAIRDGSSMVDPYPLLQKYAVN